MACTLGSHLRYPCLHEGGAAGVAGLLAPRAWADLPFLYSTLLVEDMWSP
jgi:hypothetical protein